MKPLYEINHELEILLTIMEDYAEKNDGEIPSNISSQIDSLQEDKNIKTINIAKAYKNSISESEMLKNEINNLQKRKKISDNKALTLKNYLANNLKGEKFKAESINISWRKSVSVSIDDPNLLENDYFKITKKPNLSNIKEHLKQGLTVKGAFLAEKQNIQIK